MLIYCTVTVYCLCFRYFIKQGENESGTEKEDNFYWWHKMLAKYFESTDNLDRYVEVQLNYQYLYVSYICESHVALKLTLAVTSSELF